MVVRVGWEAWVVVLVGQVAAGAAVADKAVRVLEGMVPAAVAAAMATAEAAG